MLNAAAAADDDDDVKDNDIRWWWWQTGVILTGMAGLPSMTLSSSMMSSRWCCFILVWYWPETSKMIHRLCALLSRSTHLLLWYSKRCRGEYFYSVGVLSLQVIFFLCAEIFNLECSVLKYSYYGVLCKNIGQVSLYVTRPSRLTIWIWPLSLECFLKPWKMR